MISSPSMSALMKPGKQKRDLALAMFMDEDLWNGGRVVTRMAADPIRRSLWDMPKQSLPVPGIFLSKAYFRDIAKRKAEYLESIAIPLESVADEQSSDLGAEANTQGVTPEQTLTVGLVHYQPLFDPDAEKWFINVDIDPGQLAEPMVRFGWVRYQPTAPDGLRVSPPVVQWAQVMPDRHVVAEIVDKSVKVSINGAASLDAKRIRPQDAADNAERYSKLRMSMHLVMERTLSSGMPERSQMMIHNMPEDGVGEEQLDPKEPNILTWAKHISLPVEYDPKAAYFMFLEEVG